MSDAKTSLIGGVLLIIGTCIGAGMLAFPVANAPAGFVSSSALFFLAWSLMTFNAFLILEANLWMPRGSNLITMAKHTLGLGGHLLAWGTYLLLLYTLISAYISGGADILQVTLGLMGLDVPTWLDQLLFVLIFGVVVMRGIKFVDFVNRGLMTGKAILFILLIILIMPHIRLEYLSTGEAKYLVSSAMVIMTAFGFATIVPSLRRYYHDDVDRLKKVILLGSFIPLIAYIIWDVVIMGVIPEQGEKGLVNMLISERASTELTISLRYFLKSAFVASSSQLFAAVCLLTSFLGVSLSLRDCLADALRLQRHGKQGMLVIAATFLPPLLVVLFYPNAFITMISYAGVLCLILLALLPILMVWSGRYRLRLTRDNHYRVFGGKGTLCLAFLLTLVMLTIGVTQLSEPQSLNALQAVIDDNLP